MVEGPHFITIKQILRFKKLFRHHSFFFGALALALWLHLGKKKKTFFLAVKIFFFVIRVSADKLLEPL